MWHAGRAPGIAILGLLLAIAASAATIEYDVQPRALQLGESATCRITIKGAAGAPAPTLPPIDGFNVASAGTEQNINITPAGQELSVSYIYRLTPVRAGNFQVGPFTYAMKDQSVTLPAVEINVVPATGGANASPVQRWSDLLFVTLTCDRATTYIQQSFDLILSVYSQGLNLDRNIQLTDFKTAGLGMGDYNEIQSTREVVSNQVYDVRRFRVRATALTSGTFTLAPKLRVNLLVRSQRPRDPFFGDNFFDNFFSRAETQPVDIEARPLQIVVKDLPTQGRPSSFSGAVGQFTFDVQAQPQQLHVGDPVTLTMRVAGNGNIESISAPVLSLGDSFKVYDPKLVQDDPDHGVKAFEQVVIPKNASASELPPITFAYFNPQTEHYETIVRGPFKLSLDASGAEAPVVVQATGSRPSVVIPEPLGEDLVYLQPAPKTWIDVTSAPWYRTPAILSLQGLPPIALALVFLLARRRDRLATDAAHARRQEAPRSARAAMVRAEQVLRAGKSREFFEALWNVLAAYFGNRFNLEPGQVSRDEVSLRLHRAGLPAGDLEEIRDLFDLCEQLRFGIGRTADQPLADDEQTRWRARLDRLTALLRDCERLRI